ncbi:folylpolyglutamate synthase/dihydrofolate synthase family protein [Paremcibacter congregatus]|uniref:bifunctional folylpolyglutamate synthase/dihydrofolate synthase n=1 Tax=Paremcibacter congregatus TaxID=2043170 RepID=UPI0030EC5F9B|tara:strand:+ start:4603 stop:5898 length:1296 start_codon:yes stop_codon:yes gene_type:complete
MTRPSDQVLERLFRLHPKKIDLSLDRMTALLDRLGNPERRLPPVIHVAGTNGKGSTTAYLRAILEAQGLRVHVYSSPHLVRFAERIRLAGKIIDEDILYRHLVECEEINGSTPITYFEITTAIALKAFADHPADVLLLEVGLGGRLDATNVIDQPLSTVITPVSVDHEQFLGSDLAGIAREKAGIAKTGAPLVLARQTPVAQEAILACADQVGAPTIAYGAWTVSATDDGFLYRDDYGALALPLPSLKGPHQIHNAGLAIACLRHQNRLPVSDAAIRSGVMSARWPARLQNITDSAFGHLLPEGSELWLDGGHNPAAGQILADHFAQLHDLPLYLICGMMANKDAAGFLAPLCPHVTALYGVTVVGEDSHAAEDITAFAQGLSLAAEPSTTPQQALQHIAGHSKGHAVRVLICGSLYLAGQILDQNDLLPD